MDGISLDAHSQLLLTPLNMTLGIFNVEARIKPEAWITIHYHPDTEVEATRHLKKATSRQSVQNLHNGLKVALDSFKEARKDGTTIDWNYLPYAGKV